jgi:hypothetical protein
MAWHIAFLSISVDMLSRSFPDELPDRPSKIAFRKRLVHTFRSPTRKHKQRNSASSVTPDVIYPRHAPPGPCAQQIHGSDHVRTRRTTSQPAPRVLVKAHPATRQSRPVQPGKSFSIIKLALPSPDIAYPTTSRTHSYDVPRLYRKQPPQLTVRDALADQFEKLRLPATTHTPLAPVEVPASQNTTNFSFPLQRSNSTKAAKGVKIAWNRLAVSNPILPSPREQPHSRTMQLDTNHRRQGESSTNPIVIEDDSDHSTTAGPSRPTGSHQNTNPLQSGGLSRQSLNRRRTRKDKFLRKIPDHQDQSPGTSSMSSDGFRTPHGSEGSNDSDLELHAQIVSSIRDVLSTRVQRSVGVNLDRNAQEEEDRQLAQFVQQEEDEYYDDMRRIPPLQPAETSGSPAFRAVSSPETLLDEPGPLASLQEAIDEIGTLEYFLNSNSDTDGTTRSGYRVCVVCDESIPIAELPSLAECEHQPETCADCYAAWIYTKLLDNNWSEPKCPGDTCAIVLSYHEIQLYADAETFQQYDKFKSRAAFSDDRKSWYYEHL